MNYPLISEYTEAIVSAEDNFNELTNLRPVLDSSGRPIMSSGNFAVVYKMRDIKTDKLYAVKCFTREQRGREEAYKKISDYIQKVYCDYIVKVNYYPDELYVDTNQSGTSEFPVLTMDWIEGMGLEEYISQNANNHDKLDLLSSNFIDLISSLLPKHFAHGDLKPDNIIIDSDDKIKLIDYDGMFVPSMEGEISPELGTPKFQFRNRKPEDFNEYIDDYGALYLSILIRLVVVGNSTFDSLLSLDIPNLIISASKYVDDTVLSKLLAAFILSYNRGFIEREILSICLYNDNKYDREKELSYVSRARKGDTKAMIVLGDTYSRGFFTPENPYKAIDWYYLARALGDINAACGVCRHYYHFENDFFGLDIADNLIHKNLLLNQTDFSLCREGEENMTKDEGYAFSYFAKAKELNFAPAIYWLAKKQTFHREKISLLEESCRLGFREAMDELGSIYRKGEDSISKDYAKALLYHKRAAEAGKAFSQYIIGKSYLYGWHGHPQSITDAVKWLKLAADQMYADAICALAELYISGDIVPRDTDFAFKLLNSIINTEDPNDEALYILGRCYETGTGIQQDIRKAASYFSRAIQCATDGISKAEIQLDLILRLTKIKDVTSLSETEEIHLPGESNTGQYSDDWKRFLCYFGTYGEEYAVKEGTKVLCDNSFNDIYSECDGHYLEHLILPESLRRIGNNVFCASIKRIDCSSNSFVVENNMLLSRDRKILYRYFGAEEYVDIPSTVIYIKGGAFSEKIIKQIRIPDSVIYVGANPFAGAGYNETTNTGFRKDIISPRIISESPHLLVKGNCLYSKIENTLIACWSKHEPVIIQEGCQRIGENAFWDAHIEHLSLPSSIVSIHQNGLFGHHMNLDCITVPYNEEDRLKKIIRNVWSPTSNIIGLPF